MLQFNHISREQMNRLDLSISALIPVTRVFELEPNSYNAFKLLTSENGPSAEDVSLVDWLMKSMSNSGIIAVWQASTVGARGDVLRSRLVQRAIGGNNLVSHIVRATQPMVERMKAELEKRPSRPRRETAYDGPPVEQRAYAALYSMITDGEPINAGASFDVMEHMQLEHGAVDAKVRTAAGKIKNVILFPDELKKL